MGKSGFKGKAPDAVARMNFLYQAAHVVLNEGRQRPKKAEKKDPNFVVANHYTHLMVGIGLKSVQRSSKAIKRTVCKGCRGLLIPGLSADTTVKSGKKFRTLCKVCATKKEFPILAKAPKKK